MEQDRPLLKWLTDNPGAHPREVLRPKSPAEEAEKKAAKALRHLKARAEQGTLDPEVHRQLSEVLSTWKDKALPASLQPTKVKREVVELLDWCEKHHSATLITTDFNDQLCTDRQGHDKWRGVLRRVRQLVAGPQAALYAEAFALLDRKYPDEWRPSRRRRRVVPEEIGPSAPCDAQPTFQEGDMEVDNGLEADEEGGGDEGGEEEDGDQDGQGPSDEPRAPSDRYEEEDDREEQERLMSEESADGGYHMEIVKPDEELVRRVAAGSGQRQKRKARLVAPPPQGPACRTLDPLMREGLMAQRDRLKKPVAKYAVVHDLGLSSVGIEDEGFVEGAVFVLTPSVPDWMALLSRPLPAGKAEGRSMRRRPGEAVDPFSTLTLTASYKGYGPWRRELQHDVFMILCLSCRPEAMTLEKREQITAQLQAADLSKEVRELLLQRKRRPVPSEWPIVGGGGLEEVQGAAEEMLERLSDIAGLSLNYELHRGADAQDGVPVRPTRESTQTAQRPFAVINAGDLGETVFSVATDTKLPVGRQGVRLLPQLQRGRLSHEEGREACADRLFTYGDVEGRLGDAGLVALSFLRAHAPWLQEQYELFIDPRRRYGLDYFLSINEGKGCTGVSGGGAYAVVLAAHLLNCMLPTHVYVTGAPTISGPILPVCGYREKILTLGQPHLAQADCTPHILVPAASVKDGVLVDTEEAGAEDTSAYVQRQVRLPRKLLGNIRILAVADLFECINLCVYHGEVKQVVRPEGDIPGLAVANTLCHNRCGVSHAKVEVFLYPGNGQFIITAGTENKKRLVKAGIDYVKLMWDEIKRDSPLFNFKKDPRDADFDLHVNVPATPDSSVDDPPISLAAAAAFLSLLSGLALPASAAFVAETGIGGYLTPQNVDGALLKAAREHGIKKIFNASSASEQDEAFWAACSAEERGEVQLHHIKTPSGLMPYLWQDGGVALQPLPQFMPAVEQTAQPPAAPNQSTS